MNLSRKIINLCESVIRENRKRIYEDNLSIRYNVQYIKDDSKEYPFTIDLSKTTTDRLEFIQNSIQDKIDSNDWKEKGKDVDNNITRNVYATSDGEVVIYYPNNAVYPASIEFQSERISDEFFKDITIDFIPTDQEEPQEEEPEEPEPQEEEPEGGENDEITPNGFATRNEEPNGTVKAGESANGDDLSSLNIG